MKSILLFCLLTTAHCLTVAQTPTYYYYDPPNAGVNNLYFNTITSYKFLFIITQNEWSTAGVTAPVLITSLWLKSNTPSSLNINDLKITLGHSTLTTPVAVFADNFDTGSPVQVLNEANYNYVMIGAPWNDPPAGWSEIPLTAPFLYNASDNMVVQCEYSGINYPIPIYANNGGIPIAQICSVFDSTIADSYTARPMIGISGAQSPVNFAASDSSVCEKFCIDFFDFSSNSPLSWLWDFPGGVPPTSTDQNPGQICYDNPGVFDVTLITSNSTDADTLVLPGFITVYPTPTVPSITVSGNTLTSSPADSYQWQYNFTDIPGATGQSYVATQSGAFTIVITDVSGCTALNTIDFTLTGEIKLMPGKNIYVFPNPATDKIYIVGLDDFHSVDLSIQITNTMGDVVLPANKFSSTVSHSSAIDLSHFSAGIYFLKFSGSMNSNPVSVVKKIVIE